MKLPGSDENELDIVISEPHDKGVLTTRTGRKIENVSLEDLLVIALLALTISSEYFFIFTPLGHGLNTNEYWSLDLFLNSIYFSSVTFTTLGYGDISPVGAGRAVAVALVLSGIIIVTLIIGKVASERQQSLLLLLHTSDCQRRIAGFIENLEEYLRSLRELSGCSRHIKPEHVKFKLNGLKDLLEAIENYVAFHLYQSKMIDFGNATAVTMLLKKKEELADVLVIVFRSSIADEVICGRCLALSKKLASFEALVFKFQDNKNLASQSGSGWRSSFIGLRSMLVLVENNIVSSQAKDRTLKNKYNSFRAIAHSETSEWIFRQVEKLLLPGPRTQWPPHQHKRIAKELGISNSLAQTCIKILIQRGGC